MNRLRVTGGIVGLTWMKRRALGLAFVGVCIWFLSLKAIAETMAAIAKPRPMSELAAPLVPALSENAEAGKAQLRADQDAADAGEARAMTHLGDIYQGGLGVTQDYAQARAWHQKAADADDADAMSSLGLLYQEGAGVAQDYAKARGWYQKAANGGNALARTNLGWLYQNGRGVTPDYAQARAWYQKGADAGNADAMNHMGYLYQNGWGVTRNHAKAQAWYRKPAFASAEPTN